jgi:hypothetical protein
LYFGQEGMENPENTSKIMKFKKMLAEERLYMLKSNEIDKIFEKACLEGTEETLNPDKQTDNEEER